MANDEHLNILKQGVKTWNKWRSNNRGIRPDLSSAILRRADLSGADLRGANLIKTNLIETDLSTANLREANLGRANLGGANLSTANLGEANLFKANLIEAKLNSTYPNGADLSEALLGYTMLGDIDLRQVKGLDTIRHRGPSTIGIDTIFKSKGKIPESFLRGCGLKDVQIEMVKLHDPDLTATEITTLTYRIYELLVKKAFHYYSCFISYSSRDTPFAERLHADLQRQGVRCWFAPEDMKIGDKIRPTIDESIRIHDKLLLVLSEHSMASKWVEHEVEHALDLEMERGEPVLFPVKLDQAVMESKTGWAAKIRRERHIGDFSQWKQHDAFQKGFERLLRDLKATGNEGE